MLPDTAASALDDGLAAVRRRVWLAEVLRSAGAGLLVAACVSAAGWSRGWPPALAAGLATGLVVAAAIVTSRRSRRRREAIAACIEAAHPELRNLVITAVELRAHPERASDWMRSRVLADAGSRIASVDRQRVADLKRPAMWAALGATAWLAVAFGLPARGASAARDLALAALARAGVVSRPLQMVARVEPPAYTGLPARELRDPERIDTIQGARLRIRLTAGARAWRVRLGTRALPLRADEDGVLTGEAVLAESGYLAVEPAEPPGDGPGARLVPIVVTPDRAPAVRIEAPGRDLLLPVTAARVPITASATDDLGLQGLEVRYTRVSGSGEQFEFEEGTLPVEVTRTDARGWTARGALSLAALALAPGDTLVYRAVARDRRPGTAGLASSDTFFIEIRGPGQVPLDGVEMPPDQERYALSQQMVVLKIERLRARERSMSRGAVEDEAAAIAAEQRAVRANFIFLMGGHVEDEFEEAEQSHEIQEGRLENTARRDISQAIHQMSLAEQGLIAVDTGRALPRAKAAVEALQRAFGHNRYFLRTISPRSRIDPSRRLTGELSTASGWTRDPASGETSAADRALRDLFAAMLDVAANLDRGRPVEGARVTALAERALAVDPGSPQWQQVSGRLMELRRQAGKDGDSREAIRILNEALAPIMAAVQAGARGAFGEGTAPAGALRSAWTGEVRR